MGDDKSNGNNDDNNNNDGSCDQKHSRDERSQAGAVSLPVNHEKRVSRGGGTR